ncbi:sodium:proton exchanger [Nocardia mangyaensis]|uniref:Sodium:proton exchanger n=1 Tax=Nocardia mangyaensis TaxID=2213200 RepID=A0A1J0VQK8_9NOCA|nr:cation:proton antiporter [Nocardia mangyaensis]APE34317.1 sodium:proton exchanger [Nocardia mangyaensis]
MIEPILAVSTALVVWAMLAGWFERHRITAPMVVVAAGIVIGALGPDTVGEALNASTALHAAEIILAILLFIDSSEVRGRLLGSHPGAALRVLLVATPLSIAAAMLLGAWVFPKAGWALLLVLACVVVPTDFSPAAATLRDDRVPAKVRDVLNIEAGYKDGLLAPVLFFGIALAAGTAPSGSALGALGAVSWAVGVAIVVGATIGWLLGRGVNAAERRGLMTTQSGRVIVVVAPVLAFAASYGLGGNEFVAPFLCGVVFHHLRRRSAHFVDGHRLIDDVGFLLTAQMWFVFGAAAFLALTGDVSWQLIVFCLAVLTVVRMAPIALSLLGSEFTKTEVLLIGWLGPRGTPSIVFGLLAFNLLPTDDGDDVLSVMVLTVLGSIVLHGAGSPLAAHLLDRRRARRQVKGAGP